MFADEIPLRLRLALLRFVTLSAVEIRARRGSNDARHHLGSEAQKFDSLRSLRMTVGDTRHTPNSIGHKGDYFFHNRYAFGGEQIYVLRFGQFCRAAVYAVG